MPDFSISDEEYQRLVHLRKRTPNRRRADRIKVMLWLAKCWTVEDVAEALLVDDVTVRRWHKESSRRRRKLVDPDVEQGGGFGP